MTQRTHIPSLRAAGAIVALATLVLVLVLVAVALVKMAILANQGYSDAEPQAPVSLSESR